MQDALTSDALGVRRLGARERLVLTLLGWPPGVRTLLRPTMLPCGCHGRWGELGDGAVAFLIDSRGRRCRCVRHVVGTRIEAGAVR